MPAPAKGPHVPLLRFGRIYESYDSVLVRDHRTHVPLATLSQANPGLVRRDLAAARAARDRLRRTPHAQVLAACRRAADIFLNAELPAGLGRARLGPEEYVALLSQTSGLTYTMCRDNMRKIHRVLAGMDEVLHGLSRGVSLARLDAGPVRHDGLLLSYYPVAAALSVVLPSNSPGVNTLWLPSVGLRVPVMLKPGSEEPWTPWRILMALREAGVPEEALGHYPGSHEIGSTLVEGSERSVIFGDDRTVARYRKQPSVSVHGAGYSKVVVGPDKIHQMGRLLDLMIESVLANGGRSCVNASTIVVPSRGREIAELLADRLAAFEPAPLTDPEARLAAFAKRTTAEAIDTAISTALRTPGAEDLTARKRTGPRRVTVDRSTFLQPTVIWCESPDHPLAKREYSFPFVAVVQLPPERMVSWLGPTLACTAVTDDPELRRALTTCPSIDRLNLGEIPTNAIAWDQPHEGNLFEHLFRRRAVQVAESRSLEKAAAPKGRSRRGAAAKPVKAARTPRRKQESAGR